MHCYSKRNSKKLTFKFWTHFVCSIVKLYHHRSFERTSGRTVLTREVERALCRRAEMTRDTHTTYGRALTRRSWYFEGIDTSVLVSLYEEPALTKASYLWLLNSRKGSCEASLVLRWGRNVRGHRRTVLGCSATQQVMIVVGPRDFCGRFGPFQPNFRIGQRLRSTGNQI